jgi:hypothetical protein
MQPHKTSFMKEAPHARVSNADTKTDKTQPASKPLDPAKRRHVQTNPITLPYSTSHHFLIGDHLLTNTN